MNENNAIPAQSKAMDIATTIFMESDNFITVLEWLRGKFTTFR